jgi:hypothetical protein
LNTGNTIPLTDDTDINESFPSWSFDGEKIAFVSNREGSDDVWVKDLVSGSLNRATDSGYPSYPKISPDGEKLAYFEYETLYVVDLSLGDTLMVDDNTDWYSIDWSPDSKKILFISYTDGNGDIFAYDLDNSSKTRVTVTSNGMDYPMWSPDGNSIVFARYEDDWSVSVWITSSDAQDQRKLLQQNLYNLNYLSWIRSGAIAYRDQQDELDIVYIEGYFGFKNVQLDAGENIFYANATDASGHVSSPSEEISVMFDTGFMPDLETTDDDIFIYPSYPTTGEQVSINIVVWNTGQFEARDVDVDIYMLDSYGNIELLKSENIPYIEGGSGEVIGLNWDSSNKSGVNTVIAVIDPGDKISEISESNNISMKEIIVVTLEGVSMTTKLTSDTYEINQDLNISIALRNSGIEKDVTVATSIEDEDGNAVVSLNTVQAHLPYASRKDIELTWNTGLTFAGTYRVHTVLKDENSVLAENIVPFVILPDKKIDSKVNTDKISYLSNKTATITSTIQSASANYIFENLDATLTVANSQGTVLYTETSAIPVLIPGQLVELKTYWNTGANPQGEYPVTLEVKEASGTVLSESTKTLIISSDIKPSVLLRGQISVDKQSLLQGETVNISYSVTNVGNVDLPQIDLSILTVHVVKLTAYDTLTDQTALQMGAAYSNTKQLDTNNYSAKDYLVILRAKISGVEETLAGTYFRVEGAPSAPSLNWPGNGDDIETYTSPLTVNNASDPNNDDLVYEFELYSDSSLSNLLASSAMIQEGEGVTSWQVPMELQENAVYCWRVRAYDGQLHGGWMTTASFRVNTYNDLPTAPTLSSPANNSEVDTLTPTLVVNNSTDPDSINLTYNFEVALDPYFKDIDIVTSQIGVFEGVGTTSWQVPEGILSENTRYYWRAQADDWLIDGPWMETATFFVNTENDAPTAPVIIAPSDGSETTTLYADITVSNGTDPDYDLLTYIFQVDTVNTFDSPNLLQSGNIPEGADTTSWHIEGLSDNTYYYVRAKASDGLSESPWSEVIGFFANTANDAPTTPVLANPSDGAGVNVFTPTLSVHNSTDIDRDVLTYEFEVYDDAEMTIPVTSASRIEEGTQITSWTVPVTLTENETYFWRARASDGELYSGWMPLASFMINTANDAPGAPLLHAPAEGSSVDTLNPTLSVYNAIDPDSDTLTYDFEIYSNGTLVDIYTGIPEGSSGVTSVTLLKALTDNTTYTWTARAYDGDSYSEDMDTATFIVHLPIQNITATIDFDPNTLNKKSNGKWVTVYIELPDGYDVNDIIISSILLEGTVPAETWPYSIGDHDKDGIPDLMVKFKRADVINILPNGDNVLVHVSGTVGTVTFDGVDTIRVIH